MRENRYTTEINVTLHGLQCNNKHSDLHWRFINSVKVSSHVTKFSPAPVLFCIQEKNFSVNGFITDVATT